jgi:hypothetical protein
LRENNYNTGLRGVLFDAEHYARMGAAVWLYGWLVLRQTHQTGTIGWVLGGAPIHYREIEEETGFNRRTLERWMKNLRRQKYIETSVVDSGITIRILKAKKHLHRGAESKGVPRTAESPRKSAEALPQKCVAGEGERYSHQQVAGGIGSSFVVGIKDKEEPNVSRFVENQENCATETSHANTHEHALSPETATREQDSIHKSSWLGQNQRQKEPCPSANDSIQPARRVSFPDTPRFGNETSGQSQRGRSSSHESSLRHDERASSQQKFSWDLRERMRLIRAERDEAVRRELAVGSGPEVPRS